MRLGLEAPKANSEAPKLGVDAPKLGVDEPNVDCPNVDCDVAGWAAASGPGAGAGPPRRTSFW